MDYDQVVEYFKEKIFDHFASALGNRDIFFFGNNFHKPSGSYIVMRVASLDEIGWPTLVGYTQDGEAIQRQDYEISIDVIAYRGSPFGTLSKIKKSLSQQWGPRQLKDDKIGFLNWTSITDRTTPIDDITYEQRASQTYTFSIRIENTDSLPIEEIAQVDFKGEVVGLPEFSYSTLNVFDVIQAANELYQYLNFDLPPYECYWDQC